MEIDIIYVIKSYGWITSVVIIPAIYMIYKLTLKQVNSKITECYESLLSEIKGVDKDVMSIKKSLEKVEPRVHDLEVSSVTKSELKDVIDQRFEEQRSYLNVMLKPQTDLLNLVLAHMMNDDRDKK